MLRLKSYETIYVAKGNHKDSYSNNPKKVRTEISKSIEESCKIS